MSFNEQTPAVSTTAEPIYELCDGLITDNLRDVTMRAIIDCGWNTNPNFKLNIVRTNYMEHSDEYEAVDMVSSNYAEMPETKEYILNTMEKEVDDGSYYYYLSYGGSPLTFFRLKSCGGRKFKLEKFNTRKEFRGKGVGTIFLKTVLSKIGFDEVELEALAGSKNVDFYKSLGFEILSTGDSSLDGKSIVTMVLKK